MRIYILSLVLLLASCKKDPVRVDVSYGAQCRMCAVEYITGDGDIRRDTIIGRFDWSGSVVDTLQGTGQWNVVLDAGDRLYIRACHLRSDSVDGAITVTTNVGDSQGSLGGACASIDRAVHQ